MRRVQVTEILSRAQQGRTEPFLCRCDDGGSYYVKGKSAGRAGLAAEVICANLAQRLGLPVPEAVIADVAEELVFEGKGTGLAIDDLGPGPAFGSKVVQAVEFTNSHRESVDQELAERLVVFDWWVQNEDRTLTEIGGNVNLLWQISPIEGLVVIDHNLAFTAFDPARFLQTHVFADELKRVCTDFDLRTVWSARLQQALQSWDDVCALVPQEWGFIDFEQTVPSNLNFPALRAILNQFLANDFWMLP